MRPDNPSLRPAARRIRSQARAPIRPPQSPPSSTYLAAMVHNRTVSRNDRPKARTPTCPKLALEQFTPYEPTVPLQPMQPGNQITPIRYPIFTPPALNPPRIHSCKTNPPRHNAPQRADQFRKTNPPPPFVIRQSAIAPIPFRAERTHPPFWQLPNPVRTGRGLSNRPRKQYNAQPGHLVSKSANRQTVPQGAFACVNPPP